MSDERLDLSEPADPDTDGTVLELFGVKLSVQNPRLAEILTMDAKDALTADLKELADPATVRSQRAELREAVPDIVVTPETAHDAHDAQVRADFRARVDNLGRQLGFDVDSGGGWSSPTGAIVVVRAIEKDISYVAASDFAHKLDVLRVSRGGPDAVGLFVTAAQPACDIFKVAIRQSRLYGNVRTISAESLGRLSDQVMAGVIGHDEALLILLPLAGADVGEIVSLLSSVRPTAE